MLEQRCVVVWLVCFLCALLIHVYKKNWIKICSCTRLMEVFLRCYDDASHLFRLKLFLNRTLLPGICSVPRISLAN